MITDQHVTLARESRSSSEGCLYQAPIDGPGQRGFSQPSFTPRHPAATTWVRTDDGARPNSRLIDRSDSPASNLSHNSVFSD